METVEKRDQFEEVIKSEEPIIVKVFVGWCPDCKRLDMFIPDIIEEFGNYKWYQVNSDEIEGFAEDYEVMGIPSILIFQKGEKIAHQHSAFTKTPESVREFLHQQLG